MHGRSTERDTGVYRDGITPTGNMPNGSNLILVIELFKSLREHTSPSDLAVQISREHTSPSDLAVQISRYQLTYLSITDDVAQLKHEMDTFSLPRVLNERKLGIQFPRRVVSRSADLL